MTSTQNKLLKALFDALWQSQPQRCVKITSGYLIENGVQKRIPLSPVNS